MHHPNTSCAYPKKAPFAGLSGRPGPEPPSGGISHTGAGGPDGHGSGVQPYFSAPAVSPATTCRWKTMYAARTGSIAITSPAKSPDQSPL